MAAAAAHILLVTPRPPPPPEIPVLALNEVAFSALEGWEGDDHDAALAAFARSCRRLGPRPDGASMGGADLAGAKATGPIAGTVGDWRQPCRSALELADSQETGNPAAARAFFENAFSPFAVTGNGEARGLFTGYYEIVVSGSRTAGAANAVPAYRRPPDLVMVNLGRFRPEFRGRRIAGRVAGAGLVPYATRAEIDDGGLAGRGLELLWLDNPVDAFFLHIQGSGVVEMDDGAQVRIGYDGDNGHVFTGIGRLLLDRGVLGPGQMSMQSIRAWLAAHPRRGAELMAENARYVFFHEITGDGPVGAQGVALTPRRSLAVDRKYLALGVPMWLETEVPEGAAGATDATDAKDGHFHHLMVAQDTGSAIRGPVRGDLYWGSGAEAGAAAGRMKHEGRYFLLLPRALAERRRP